MELERIMEMIGKRTWNYNETDFIKWLIEREDTYKVRIAELENQKRLLIDGIGNLTQRLETEETLRREKNERIAELEQDMKSVEDAAKGQYKRIVELEGEVARLTKTHYEGDEGEAY